MNLFNFREDIVGRDANDKHQARLNATTEWFPPWWQEAVASALAGAPMGDSQCATRQYVHNPIAFIGLHQDYTSKVSEYAGKELKPSYCYLVKYQRGSSLDVHVDREQCEYNVSIMIDCRKWVSSEEGWPLILGDDLIPHVPGQALIYSGHTPHGRPPLLFDEATVLFLHYVSKDYVGELS